LSFLFGLTVFLGVYWFFRSPLPAALAESMRHSSTAPDPALLQKLGELGDELQGLREDVMELAERMDFTERVLADLRRRPALPDPSARD